MSFMWSLRPHHSWITMTALSPPVSGRAIYAVVAPFGVSNDKISFGICGSSVGSKGLLIYPIINELSDGARHAGVLKEPDRVAKTRHTTRFRCKVFDKRQMIAIETITEIG